MALRERAVDANAEVDTGAASVAITHVKVSGVVAIVAGCALGLGCRAANTAKAREILLALIGSASGRETVVDTKANAAKTHVVISGVVVVVAGGVVGLVAVCAVTSVARYKLVAVIWCAVRNCAQVDASAATHAVACVSISALNAIVASSTCSLVGDNALAVCARAGGLALGWSACLVDAQVNTGAHTVAIAGIKVCFRNAVVARRAGGLEGVAAIATPARAGGITLTERAALANTEINTGTDAAGAADIKVCGLNAVVTSRVDRLGGLGALACGGGARADKMAL